MEDYLKLLHKIYDFGLLRKLLARRDFRFTFDGMHGVAGPYAQRIFVKVRPPKRQGVILVWCLLSAPWVLGRSSWLPHLCRRTFAHDTARVLSAFLDLCLRLYSIIFRNTPLF